jgi:mutator protein MutT
MAGMIKVAAAFIRNGEGKFLVAERAKGHLAGKWEFPGGKIEPDETETKAIEREILEELGLCVNAKETICAFSMQYPDKEIHLSLIRCELSDNDQQFVLDGVSHFGTRWVDLDDCAEMDFAPIDIKMLGYLRESGLA